MENIWAKVVELFSSTTVSDFFAGIAGGIVAIRFEKEKLSIRRSLAIIGFGVIGSIYLGGLIVDFFELAEKAGNGVRFICGLTALKLFEGILTLADIVRKDPIGFIKKYSGNGNAKKPD